MVIDTSAVIAILFDEPEAPLFEELIAYDRLRLFSTASLLEANFVVERVFGDAGARELDLFLHKGHLDVVAVNREQAEVGRRAWRRYGKGRHPAGLNFGDCFSYALAKVTGEPLLFKGDDFKRTDLRSVADSPIQYEIHEPRGRPYG